MTIKLDKPKVVHSVASESDDRVWWYEELEGEILAFAQYCAKKSKTLKGDKRASAMLQRVGRTLNTLKQTSAMSTGTWQDLFTKRKDSDKD